MRSIPTLEEIAKNIRQRNGEILKGAIDSKRFRELASVLRESVGSEVLVVKQTEHFGNTGIISSPDSIPRRIFIKTEEVLGVLNGSYEIDLEQGELILPTSQHVLRYDEALRRGWRLKTENIAVSGDYVEKLDQEVEPGRKLGGRGAIETSDDLLNPPQMEVGLSIYTGRDVEDYFRSRRDTLNYIDGLDILGVEGPADLRADYNTKMQELRNKTLNYLIRTNAVTGGELTELGRDSLRVAIRARLHQKPATITLERGITVDVPEYITAQCEKYGIEIPK